MEHNRHRSMKYLHLAILATLTCFSCTKEEHFHQHISISESLKGRHHVMIQIHNDREQMTFAVGEYARTIEAETINEETTVYKTDWFHVFLDFGNMILFVETIEETEILSVKPELAIMSENVKEELSRYPIQEDSFELSFEQELGEDLLQTGNSVFAAFDIKIK